MQVLDDDTQLLAELRGYPFLQDLVFRADIIAGEQGRETTYKYVYLAHEQTTFGYPIVCDAQSVLQEEELRSKLHSDFVAIQQLTVLDKLQGDGEKCAHYRSRDYSVNQIVNEAEFESLQE